MKKLHIKKYLKYDITTGIFYNRKTEKPVGKIDDFDGCIYIHIDKVKYNADTLAWRYVTGEWSKHPLIHLNGINSDNWITNLKPVPVKKPPKNNKSKVTGVYRDKQLKKWRVQIFVDGKQKSLGSHDKFELAVLARYKAETLYGFDYLNSTAGQYINTMFL